MEKQQWCQRDLKQNTATKMGDNSTYLRTERKWAGGGRVKGSLPKFTPSTVPPSSTNTGVKEAPTGRPATGTV